MIQVLFLSIPGKNIDFSLCHYVQMEFGSHPGSCQRGIGKLRMCRALPQLHHLYSYYGDKALKF
jgi:hypothetical protein